MVLVLLNCCCCFFFKLKLIEKIFGWRMGRLLVVIVAVLAMIGLIGAEGMCVFSFISFDKM